MYTGRVFFFFSSLPFYETGMGDVKALINQLFEIEKQWNKWTKTYYFFFKLSSFGLDPGQDGRFLTYKTLSDEPCTRVTGDVWVEVMVAQ